MQTKKLFSSLVNTGMRLVIFVSMLMTALANNVSPVAAAPTTTLTAITLGAPSGTLTVGTAGSITYLVTVTKNNANNFSNATLSISWTGGTPTGVTTSFSTNPVSWGGSGGNRTSTLTINTTAATPAAVRNFTVRAQRNFGDFQTVGGTLTVSAPLLIPTITFGAPPAPTFPGGNFNVSATTNSNGALTYTVVSGPCALVSGNTFSTSGVGICVVQANTAATSTYAAGSAQQSVTIIAGSGSAFDLWAVTGSTTLPGPATAIVWGYSLTNAPVSQPGGPILVVNQGALVTITLHNQLGENTALLFQGQSLIPDTTGANAGGTKTYTFTASRPGTFLYEAGLIPGKQHQVAMGLYGALIVRPTGFAAVPGQAYAASATAFDAEQVLVLSELDTALNNSLNPAAFDMRAYGPKYYLINGKAYPATDAVSATSGNKMLLRYVNAGLQAHAMSTLGLSQNIIGQDGSAFAFSHSVVTETIAPGQTLDTIVAIPGSAALGTQYPIYDASLFLRNNKGTSADSTAGLGGMLTTLTVGTSGGSGSGPDTTGPVASGLGLAPNPTNGSVDVSVSASLSDVATGNSNIDTARFYIDSTAGSPIAMTGTFGSPTAAVTGTIPAATLGILASGNHTIYVQGHDVALNWGAFLPITLNLDKSGPTTSNLALSGLDLSATGNDTASGNSNVTAAEYWVDAGSHVTMTLVGSAAPISNFTATLPSVGPGAHIVSVRSQDSFGNWGAASTINLNGGDTVAPTTNNVNASPNPNNGSTPFNTSVIAVRVTADFSDVASGNSNIAAAEGFLNAAGATGTGFVFIALDGNFDSPAEPGYADIPLAVVNTLSDGAHAICVHAKDASGNWGVVDCSYMLNIDRTAPTVLSITRVGASPTNGPSVQFLVTFSESVTGVTSGNFATVRTGLTGTSTITSVTGTGATRTVTATTGTGTGTIGLNLTPTTGITDLAGNALTNGAAPVNETYTIVPTLSGNLYFSTTGTVASGSRPGGVVGADTADIYFYNGSAFSTSIDVSAITNPIPAGANVDGFDRVDATHFYMSFSGNVTVPGITGTVADEDVVYYNAGTWSLYFDGSANGLTGGSATDLDAISIVGGTLYFSTDNTAVPPSVSGGGDDADIYSWNGSTFVRVFDATALGWSGNNVDGFVFIDATHFYLSYEPTTTTVSGLGSVQDEDIVKYDAGVWSVYFDGTSLGLGTSGNLDIDAFDIP
ncbi:MAG: multicopper oxidase domain-containing protein [Chloroflexota bacterium]